MLFRLAAVQGLEGHLGLAGAGRRKAEEGVLRSFQRLQSMQRFIPSINRCRSPGFCPRSGRFSMI